MTRRQQARAKERVARLRQKQAAEDAPDPSVRAGAEEGQEGGGMMRTLEECKAAIRLLSVEDRGQLIVWLVHGMTASESPSPSAAVTAAELEKLAEESSRKHIAYFRPAEPPIDG
jgi:hypothetical protein